MRKLGLLIFVLLLITLLSLIGYFIYSGTGGYTTTIVLYLTLAVGGFLFVHSKVVKVNYLIIIALLFAFESYFRIFRSDILDYNENNHSSLLANYLSPFTHFVQKDNTQREPGTSMKLTTKEYDYMHIYNEEGNRELPLDSFVGKPNFLLLGDSFSEGVGVEQDSMPSRLMERLISNFRIYNAGLSGSDIFLETKKLNHLGPKLKPTLVILQLNTSDVADVYYRGGEERFDQSVVQRINFPWWEIPYSFSYIFRWIATQGLGINPSIWAENDMAKKHTLASLKKIYTEILHMHSICKKNNTQLLVVFNTTYHELSNNFSIYDSYDASLKEKGIPHFYVYKKIIGRKFVEPKQYPNLFYKYDQHYTLEGYKLFSFLVVDHIYKNNE